MAVNKPINSLLSEFRHKLSAIILRRDKKIKEVMDRIRLEAVRRDLK